MASDPQDRPRRTVQAATDKLRDWIWQSPAETRIGSLSSIAEALGVGIVTVQQAARVLEHEGLLAVRRGPGGGYYARRPDAASLERALAAYMRAEPRTWEEALDMTSLLFNELAGAAARCRDESLRDELRQFEPRVETCSSEPEMAVLEEAFQDLLFRMVNRPLFEMLTRVTLSFAASRPAGEPLLRGALGLDRWIEGRRRIIAAILDSDAELARFEADRQNRRILLDRVRPG